MQLVTHPSSLLRGVARPVAAFDDKLGDMVADMRLLMLRHNGAGLAAPQVGIPLRVFVVGISGDRPSVFVNPEIESYGGGWSVEYERCLSIPGVAEPIRRPRRVVVSASGIDGERFTVSAEGLLARCIQHEIDHLDGVLIVDRAEADLDSVPAHGERLR